MTFQRPFVRLGRNDRGGRDLLVGDVHGHFTKLRQALAAAGFDTARDRLIIAGDLVDRGPESRDVLQWLEQPWCFAVQGNHEAMTVAYHRRQLDSNTYGQNGGHWAIGMTPEERQPYVDAFDALPLALELETAAGLVGVVHADMPFSDWSQLEGLLASAKGFQCDVLREWLQWSRKRADGLFSGAIAGVRAVVVGHTPVDAVTSLDNVLFIDTGAWLRRRAAVPFTLIDAATLAPVRQLAAVPAAA